MAFKSVDGNKVISMISDFPLLVCLPQESGSSVCVSSFMEVHFVFLDWIFPGFSCPHTIAHF